MTDPRASGRVIVCKCNKVNNPLISFTEERSPRNSGSVTPGNSLTFHITHLTTRLHLLPRAADGDGGAARTSSATLLHFCGCRGYRRLHFPSD